MVRLLRKVEIVAPYSPQDHLLDPAEIDEVIFEGEPDPIDEGLGGVVSKELVQPPNGADSPAAVSLLEAIDEMTQDFVLGSKVALLGARFAASPLVVKLSMLGLSDALTSSRRLLHVFAERDVPIEDAEAIERLVDAEPPANQLLWVGDRVPVGMERDVALDIDVPLVSVVDVRDMGRRRSESRLLGNPEGSRCRSKMAPKG